MMDGTIIIVIAIIACVAVAEIAGVAYVLWRKHKGETTFVWAPVKVEPANTDTPANSIEEINRKYEGMAETDPIQAGRLKYNELLRFHGK